MDTRLPGTKNIHESRPTTVLEALRQAKSPRATWTHTVSPFSRLRLNSNAQISGESLPLKLNAAPATLSVCLKTYQKHCACQAKHRKTKLDTWENVCDSKCCVCQTNPRQWSHHGCKVLKTIAGGCNMLGWRGGFARVEVAFMTKCNVVDNSVLFLTWLRFLENCILAVARCVFCILVFVKDRVDYIVSFHSETSSLLIFGTPFFWKNGFSVQPLQGFASAKFFIFGLKAPVASASRSSQTFFLKNSFDPTFWTCRMRRHPAHSPSPALSAHTKKTNHQHERIPVKCQWGSSSVTSISCWSASEDQVA